MDGFRQETNGLKSHNKSVNLTPGGAGYPSVSYSDQLVEYCKVLNVFKDLYNELGLDPFLVLFYWFTISVIGAFGLVEHPIWLLSLAIFLILFLSVLSLIIKRKNQWALKTPTIRKVLSGLFSSIVLAVFVMGSSIMVGSEIASDYQQILNVKYLEILLNQFSEGFLTNASITIWSLCGLGAIWLVFCSKLGWTA